MNVRALIPKSGLSLALVTAVISGVSVFVNSLAVKANRDPFVFTTAKNLVVALALTGLLVLIGQRRRLLALTRGQWIRLGLIGIIGGSVPFLLFFQGLKLAPSPALPALIHKTMFLWVSLLAVRFLGERINRAQPFALAGLLLGVFLLGGVRAWSWSTAEWLVLSATLFWAVEFVLAKRLLNAVPAMVVAWARMAIGAVALLIFLIANGRIELLNEMTVSQWMWVGMTSVLLLGYVVSWYAALQRAPASLVTAVLVAALPITAFLNGLFLTRQVRTPELLGSLAITGALITFFLYQKRSKAAKMPNSFSALVTERGWLDPGIVACSRFAFKPNELGYCGPNDASGLFELSLRQRRTSDLEQILGRFETLYPYLTFIARSIGVRDPFNQDVVNAYWLGHPLSRSVSINGFYRHIGESLGLKKKIPRAALELLVGKIPMGAQPNHNFHVLNVFTRTGHATLPHTVGTMDQCRISWGVVEAVDRTTAVVRRQPLVAQGSAIRLGEPELETVQTAWEGETFVPGLKVGDAVAIHWGWACAVLSPEEFGWLRESTEAALQLRNAPAPV